MNVFSDEFFYIAWPGGKKKVRFHAIQKNARIETAVTFLKHGKKRNMSIHYCA